MAAPVDVGAGVAPAEGAVLPPAPELSSVNAVGTPRVAVGSNGTQPMPAKYTSGQECSWSVETS